MRSETPHGDLREIRTGPDAGWYHSTAGSAGAAFTVVLALDLLFLRPPPAGPARRDPRSSR